MTYLEQLEQCARDENVDIISFDLSGTRIKGLYCDRIIALDNHINTSAEKSCILAEELGHHYTTVGNILDQNDTANRKQELRARLWAYDKQIGLSGIIKGYERRCESRHELAEYLGVSEEFLNDALDCYRDKYGVSVTYKQYIIIFEPSLYVVEKIDNIQPASSERS